VSDFVRSYLTVAIFGAASIGFVGVTLGLARILRPPTRTDNTDKLLAYESGVDPVDGDWAQSQIRYYVFAVLFVIFDVEAVFIFPWAVRLEVYGAFGLIEMLIFIVILILGLVYAWRKGVLRWV
jgi:NADH-quinone oxidoreductase subunit A